MPNAMPHVFACVLPRNKTTMVFCVPLHLVCVSCVDGTKSDKNGPHKKKQKTKKQKTKTKKQKNKNFESEFTDYTPKSQVITGPILE